MIKCWASSLGNCSDKQSGEHIVSKSLFESTLVEVHGFEWCQTPMRVGIGSLTKNILCKKHNENLSTFDDAAKATFDAFRDLSKAMNETPPGTVPTAFRRRTIDAIALERWFLKTLVNFSAFGKLKIGSDGESVGIPPPSLLEVLYRAGSFAPRAGMYISLRQWAR